MINIIILLMLRGEKQITTQLNKKRVNDKMKTNETERGKNE